MAVANSGWSRADFKPLMELVLPGNAGNWKTLSRQGLEMRDAGAAAAEKHAGAQALQPAQMGDFALDQLENLLQAQGGDAVEMFQIDGLEGQPRLAGQFNGAPLDLRLERRRKRAPVSIVRRGPAGL